MNTPHPILGIGPLGTTEMLIIFVLILLLFGAKRLPTLARSIGKSLGEFRKAKDEFQEEITKGEDEGSDAYDAKRTTTPKPRPKQIPTEATASARTVDEATESSATPSGESKPA